MSIHKRSGKWIAKVYDQVAGKYIWLGTYDKKSDAAAAHFAAVQRMKQGEDTKPKQITFGRFAEGWFESLTVRRSTREDYANTLRHLNKAFGDQALSRISVEDIERFIADFSSKHADLTTKKTFVRLKQLMTLAVQRGYLSKSPADLVRNVPSAKREKQVRIASPEELQALLDAMAPHYRPLIKTAALTGLRRSELFGLRWEDVDLATGVIHVRRQLQGQELVSLKTENSKRRIRIGSSLVEVLKEHREQAPESEMGLVFATKTGAPINPSTFHYRVWQPAVLQAGVKGLTLHSLRHTYASALIRQGKDVKYMQHALGHASATTTLDTYGHLFPLLDDDTPQLLENQLFSAS